MYERVNINCAEVNSTRQMGSGIYFFISVDGFMYPVVAAFRSYLQYNEETDKYEWRNGIRPEDIWNDCKKELTSSIMNFASSIGDNPNAVGKDTNIWDLAYMKVELAKRRE